jgi:hypothetical protein
LATLCIVTQIGLLSFVLHCPRLPSQVKPPSPLRAVIKNIDVNYRDHETHKVKANMHCQDITSTKSFYTVSTSAERQKLECFNQTAINIFISTVKSSKSVVQQSYVPILSRTSSLYVYTSISMIMDKLK